MTDSRGKRFLYITDPVLKRTTLYNSSILMIDDVMPFKNTDVKTLRIGIMDESPDEIKDICNYYRKVWINGEKSAAKTQDLLLSMKNKNLTRGHFYRGV